MTGINSWRVLDSSENTKTELKTSDTDYLHTDVDLSIVGGRGEKRNGIVYLHSTQSSNLLTCNHMGIAFSTYLMTR